MSIFFILINAVYIKKKNNKYINGHLTIKKQNKLTYLEVFTKIVTVVYLLYMFLMNNLK